MATPAFLSNITQRIHHHYIRKGMVRHPIQSQRYQYGDYSDTDANSVLLRPVSYHRDLIILSQSVYFAFQPHFQAVSLLLCLQSLLATDNSAAAYGLPKVVHYPQINPVSSTR